MAWNKLCRRSFLSDNHISFIEGLIHEDCPWSFELECKANKIAMVKEVTYRYLIRQGGLQTAGEYTRHFKSYCTILKSYAKTIAESISTRHCSEISFVDWFEPESIVFRDDTRPGHTPSAERDIQPHPQPQAHPFILEGRLSLLSASISRYSAIQEVP